MDTSILGTLAMLAPDLMEEMELRALILERVAALEPIGRRALAQRLNLQEREVRTAADALRRAGCVTQRAAGMELTDYGRELVETARGVSRGRRSLAALELALASRLNAQRVCVVRGDADADESVPDAAARAAAQQIRFLLQDAHVLAVSGGQTMARTAQAISLAAPIEVTVVPAQGGTGGSVHTQANALAEAFAARLGGQHRLLHLPDGISPAAAAELARLPQLREALELLSAADVVLYGIERAQQSAASRGLGAQEREMLARQGAAGEALGLYFDAQGGVVGGRCVPALSAQALGHSVQAAAVAVGRSRAEAIVSVCLHHPHRLLVTDEGAALRMLELLRV